MSRLDFYGSIHKGQRAHMAAMVTFAGSRGMGTPADVALIRKMWDALKLWLEEHLQAEETLVHPMLREVDAAAVDALEADHKEFEAEVEALQSAIEALTATPDFTAGEEWYRQFSRLTAAYWEHIAKEEALLPAMWERYTDAELLELIDKVLLRRTVAETQFDLRLILRSLTFNERVARMRRLMHLFPDNYKELWQAVDEVLPPEDLAQLNAAFDG